MKEFEVIYSIWKREVIVILRDKYRIAISLFQPFLLLIAFGFGLSFVKVEIFNYSQFLFPAIIITSIIGISIFSGFSIIWDREFGIYKEIFVAPISRSSIFFGKVFGSATISILQSLIFLSFFPIFNLSLNLTSIGITLIVILITSIGLSSLGLFLASMIRTFEGFGVINSFVIFPLIFLSGAFYPLNKAPEWLKLISYFDPITYSVEISRYIIIGYFSIPINFSVLLFSISYFLLIFFSLLIFKRKN